MPSPGYVEKMEISPALLAVAVLVTRFGIQCLLNHGCGRRRDFGSRFRADILLKRRLNASEGRTPAGGGRRLSVAMAQNIVAALRCSTRVRRNHIPCHRALAALMRRRPNRAQPAAASGRRDAFALTVASQLTTGDIVRNGKGVFTSAMPGTISYAPAGNARGSGSKRLKFSPSERGVRIRPSFVF